jgi:hypothetical protein
MMSNNTGRRFSDSDKGDNKTKRIVVYIVVGVLIAAAITALIIMIVSGSKGTKQVTHTEGTRHDVTVAENGGADADKFKGIWVLDNITSYEFDGAGRGVIHTAMDFPFSYSAEDGALYIDVDTDDARDCRYDYTIDGIMLYLDRGDAKYTLTKELK